MMFLIHDRHCVDGEFPQLNFYGLDTGDQDPKTDFHVFFGIGKDCSSNYIGVNN